MGLDSVELLIRKAVHTSFDYPHQQVLPGK